MAFPQDNYIGGKTTTSALALARILSSISYASLPPTPVKYAKMILASTLSSAAAGANLGSVRIIRELAKEQGGKGEATIWLDGAKLPVASTGRVNAMLSDASASDDSDLRNVAHIGTCLTAVGLAVGERMNASGYETISAMVAGYEAAGRITESIVASTRAAGGDAGAGAVSGSVGRGFHASAIVAFGGVVAASKLLRLTDEQMAQAIGITATTVGGLSIGTNSWAREYHAGNAALTSINAALAASRGYTVNPDMLEARGGFLAVFTGGTPDAHSLARQIGSDDDYQISRYLAVKLVPGAHALHPAVEAAVNAARESEAKPGRCGADSGGRSAKRAGCRCSAQGLYSSHSQLVLLHCLRGGRQRFFVGACRAGDDRASRYPPSHRVGCPGPRAESGALPMAVGSHRDHRHSIRCAFHQYGGCAQRFRSARHRMEGY